MPTKQSQQNAAAARTSVRHPRLNGKGTLYLVGVPIGHPDDVTVRALQILAQVGIIASENPQVTQQLLGHHGIQAMVTSYGPRNLREKVAVLLQRLQQGIAIALVSDCGSPLIADPGHLLVAAAHQHGIPVVPIPGPSVLITALTAAGFPCDSFYFVGHLPRAAGRIDDCITDALRRNIPTVAFCTAVTVARALKTLDTMAPQHRMVLALDLTRPTELILSGTAAEMRKQLHQIRGREMTLVLSGRGRAVQEAPRTR
jgi:16S rRNA (cytidine1402-2'-O)-methyltransferase